MVEFFFVLKETEISINALLKIVWFLYIWIVQLTDLKPPHESAYEAEFFADI